jgi:hypothetical protein
VIDLLPLNGGPYARENAVVLRVRSYFYTVFAHLPELGPRQRLRVPSWGHPETISKVIEFGKAIDRRKSLEALPHDPAGLGPIGGGPQAYVARLQHFSAFGSLESLSELCGPRWTSAVDEVRSNEEGRRGPILLKNREKDIVIVVKSIIDGKSHTGSVPGAVLMI